MTEHYYINSNKYSTHERQTKRGRVYDIVFRVITADGHQKQKKLSGFTSKTDAKQGYLDFVQEHCEIAYNKPIIKQTKSSLTINDIVPKYITAISNQNKESSVYDKRNILNQFIIPTLGDTPLKELTKERLFTWQDELWSMRREDTNEPYSYNYLSKIRTCLSSLLSWAAERYDFDNLLIKVKKPRRRAPATEMKFWTREEFDAFIKTVNDPRYHAIFTTLFFTGRRKGEVIALSNKDISSSGIVFNKTYSRKTLDGSKYKITSTKNERCGSTPICEPLRAELSTYQGQAPFFFGGNEPIPETTLDHAFERYVKKSGVQPIHLHCLRHSFVSMMIHNGASVYVVADLIGDTVEQVLKTYGHLYDEDKFAALNKIK